jgi:hypothetical protein
MGIFTDVLEKGRPNKRIPDDTKPLDIKVRDWYRDKAMSFRTFRVENLAQKNPEYTRSNVRPGFLYLFNYDPKLKEELPYYDRYPLVFPFSYDREGFLGINLHYLPYIFRARLMDNLYELISNKKMDETTRLRMTYNLLNSASKYKYFKPCVKRYLHSHVRSRFLLIPSDEWELALFLPLERFAKKNKAYVFKETRNMINDL